MEPNANQIQLWYHYEEIAMHFNQLILQYRLQLMGGAGAIGAISGYLIGGNVDVAQRSWLRLLVSAGLLILIIAAAALDLFYYNQLLQGAVDALIAYEAAHPGLNMSTLIEKRVTERGMLAIYFVYGIIIVPLFIFVVWSGYRHFGDRNKAVSKSQTGPTV